MDTNRLQSRDKIGFKYSILLMLAFFFIFFNIVDAESNLRISGSETNLRESNTINLEDLNPLGKGTTIKDVIDRVISWLVVYIGPSIVTLMILWGAFRIMTAGGEPEKFKEGKNIVTYAIIGYALLLISSGLISILKEVLGA